MMKIAIMFIGILWTRVYTGQGRAVLKNTPSCVLGILVSLLILTSGIAAAKEPVKVTLKPKAIAINGGQMLLLNAKVKCDPVGDVLEAFVTVEQQGEPGVFGEGFFGAIECDGKQHKTVVTVQGFDGGFVTGEANASAFILICDAQDNCVDGQSSRIIRIRESQCMQ
jgi:hypothetical protein